ncbi:pectinesterase family protein [Nocardiopsis sinuspersici]|nr:pectinesterase family protein [Nocardiopsis sinuspersici]
MRDHPTPPRAHATMAVALAGLFTAALTAMLTTAPGDAHAGTGSSDRPHDAEGPVITVAADGSGDHTGVQAAVDAVPEHSAERVTIRVKAGTYYAPVVIPPDKPNITLVGATGDPRDVVITYDRASGTPKPGGGTYGTSGSASVVISGDDTHAYDLTFENSWKRAEHPEITSTQAVAVRTTGDRLVFDNVRFLGHQDTLYANSPGVDTPSRQYYSDCYVEGDVDFVFGRGTAVFDGCEIRSLDRGSDTTNGYVSAPSTPPGQEFGFLFTRSCFTSDAPAGTVYLGRPWVPSSHPDAEPQVLVRDSWMGRHFREEGWIEMSSGHDWRRFRMREYDNFGPGALVTEDRPQMDRSDAARHTARAYLAGGDGWDPVRDRTRRPVCTARGR